MSNRTITLTFDQARALQLRLDGHSYRTIAYDLKLDGCLVSSREAMVEARELLESALRIIDLAQDDTPPADPLREPEEG